MQRDKSSKQFKLYQLLGEEYSFVNTNVSNNSGQGVINNKSLSQSNLLLGNSNNNKISSQINPTKPSTQSINKQGRYMHFHRQNNNILQQSSFIKSKQVLEKFTNKISSLQTNNNSPSINIVKSQIQQTTNEITQQIDKRIDHSFTQLLNANTLMPITGSNYQQDNNNMLRRDNEKQNVSNTVVGLSLLQGTKMLMNDYWQNIKQKKPSTPPIRKSQSQTKLNLTLQSQSTLPKINQKPYNNAIQKSNQKVILGKVSKNEKIRQQLLKSKEQEILKSKDQQLKPQFLTYKALVVDFKVQNETIEFLTFQRINFKKWEDISFLLNCIEKFCSIYEIESGRIDLKRVLELIEEVDKKELLKETFNQQQQPRGSLIQKQSNNSQSNTTTRQFTTHELLSCFDDAQKISQLHPHSKGIRFYGVKGKKRAIIKIQSHFRRFLSEKKLKQLKFLLQKIIFIQKKYRQYLLYNKTKKMIVQNQLKKIQKFKKMQDEFKENYRHREMTRRVKYEIHICSMGCSEWQRVSTQNLNERQNVQLSRIYRVATKSSPLMQTRVIYISPCQLSKDITNYYNKIFQFGSTTTEEQQQQNIYSDRLSILWPQNIQKLPQTLSLTQKILYSKTLINRIKRIIRNNYAYIVPSKQSIQYVSLCNQLNVPLYSGEPQQLLYLQTQSGMKQFASVLKSCKDESFGVLPCSTNIYNKISFINQLTFLVFNYPTIKRWVLKIDNEHHSRGLAYIDTYKILKSQQILSQLLTQTTNINPNKQKQLKQQIYDKLYQTLIEYKQQRIIPINKQVYRSQVEYLNHFLAYGGIIQASINNLDHDLENHSFCVQIEPDFVEWKFVTSYYKITHQNKTIGAYYDSQKTIEPPIQIEYLVKQLIRRKLFGFFTFDFVQVKKSNTNMTVTTTTSTAKQDNSQQFLQPKNQQKPISMVNNNQPTSLLYFNGIKCHLDQFSSASFLKQFLSKDTNVLYIPFLSHPSLKQLRIQTFFHLCRLENISFDIKRKIGNVFMFLNGLQTGCMGLMSFNGSSKQETFEQVSDVLQFLSSKLNQSKHQLSKGANREFTAIRNVVNGHLKRARDKKLIKELKQSKSTTNMFRTSSRKQLL